MRRPGTGAGWAYIEHPILSMQLCLLPLGPPTPLFPHQLLSCQALRWGRGCVPHLTLHLPRLSLHPPPLCSRSQAGVEVLLVLQRYSPGDLSPDHTEPIRFTHMPH